MCLFGFGVYHAASLFKAARTRVVRPTETSAPALPGTMYLVQGGAIYRFAHGTFRQITSDAGWTQVSVSPDGSKLVAVKRTVNSSDLYVLHSTGRVIAQLTHNQSQSLEGNHWAFFPRFSPDSASVFFSYDPKDPYNSYRVDLAIMATGASNAAAPAVAWTEPNPYTGGDVDPIRLAKAGLLYTKFSIDGQSIVHSQVWLQARPGVRGLELTKAADDCGQPAISRDESLLAMVCRHGNLQSADVEFATLDVAGHSLGARTVLVHGALVAAPSFSPDGKLLAYLAPGDDVGPFQLWTVSISTAPAASPRQITTHLDLDPTSPPAWTSS
jgi:Tol biopolymer transport system component